MSSLKPPSASATDNISRLFDNNFDALRLLFASMVVLFHIGLLSQAPALVWLPRWVSATFAVRAFFVISGFLVTMSYERSASFLSYAQKRVRRIAPAYVTVVLLASVGLSVVSTLPLRDYFHDPELYRYLGYNLLLSNFSAPTLPGVFTSNFVPAVNGSLWTIKIELGFYLSVPIIVYLTRRFGYRRVLPALFCASIAWHVAFAYAAQLDAGHADLFERFAKQLPGQLSYFIGGAWCYYRCQERVLPSLSPAVIGLILTPLCSSFADLIVSPLALTAMVGWAALSGPRLPRAAKFGDFSYGVYLYHFPIVQTLIAAGTFALSPVLGLLATLGLVAIVSICSWNLIEAPSLARRPLGSHQAAQRVPST